MLEMCCSSPSEVRPGEEDAHEGGVGADAHGAEREEDDAGGLVLGVALERVLMGAWAMQFGNGGEFQVHITVDNPSPTVYNLTHEVLDIMLYSRPF